MTIQRAMHLIKGIFSIFLDKFCSISILPESDRC